MSVDDDMDMDLQTNLLSSAVKGKGKALDSPAGSSEIKFADPEPEQPSPTSQEPEELAPDGTPFVRGASWEAGVWPCTPGWRSR